MRREIEAVATPAEGFITALREHPRQKGRYLVELDGSAGGAVSVEVIAALGLRVRVRVAGELAVRLAAAVREVECYDKAVGALARKGRARAELGRWLRARAFTAAEIAPTLEKLTTLGLLDDQEFARAFARSRLTGRGFGPRRVAAELARRGVARELVNQALDEIRAEGGTDESAAIRAIIARRAKAMASLDPDVARRRMIGYLSRRGFSGAEILAVLDAR